MTPRITTLRRRIKDGVELLPVSGKLYELPPPLLLEGLKIGLRIQKPVDGLLTLTTLFEDSEGHWVEIARVELTEDDIPHMMNVVVR